MRLDTRAERATRRRLALLVLLHSRPHHYDELVAALDQQHLLDYDRFDDPSTIARQLRYQFRRDLAVLRLLECQIDYDRKSKCYACQNSPFGLFLTKGELSTLAVLFDTFEETTILHANEVRDLLAHFIRLLPQDQQKAFAAQRPTFSIELHETTDYRNADPITVKRIELAIEQIQQLEFSYRTPRDGKERRHVIEPKPLVFERGHVYLCGWSLDWNKDLRFRLDYIIPGSAKAIYTQLRPSRPAPVSKLLCYRLNAAIARNGVSRHFPEQTVETHADGSATVTAQVTDLFEARRILLSYGLNCLVLEPPELVEEMRTIAAELYRMYCTAGE